MKVTTIRNGLCTVAVVLAVDLAAGCAGATRQGSVAGSASTSTTSASWLNLIEGWFSVLTRKALTNASFTSTGQLQDAIDVWASRWNDDPQPFVWTKTVEDIVTKVKRGRAALNRVSESATHH